MAVMNITAAEAQAYRRKVESTIARAKSALQKADKAVDTAVRATVTGGAAFACGVAQGRYGPVEIMGVPADLAAAVGLHALGFLGIGGRSAEYMHDAGNGALSCYLATLGRGVGGDWKSRALGGGAGAPRLPAGAAASGATITDAELARMARGGI